MTDETTPSSEQNDDIEAHAARGKYAPAQPAEVEAHSARGKARNDEAELPRPGIERVRALRIPTRMSRATAPSTAADDFRDECVTARLTFAVLRSF